MYLENPADGCLYQREGDGARPLRLSPKLDSNLRCKCDLLYYDQQHPEGIVEVSPDFSCDLNLYMEHGVAKCRVSMAENKFFYGADPKLCDTF